MAELALGVLGIVPLVRLAHQSTAKKLKKFTKYNEEAKRLQQAHEIQTELFQFEWRILSKLVVGGDHDLSATSTHGVQGPKNSGNDDFNGRMEGLLGPLYRPCLYILNDINNISQALKLGLDGIILPARKPDETKSESFIARKIRIQDGLKMMSRGESYDKLINDLKDSNHQLEDIRKKVEKMSKLEPQEKDLCQARGLKKLEYLRISSECEKMRNASKALHAGLVEAWRCSHIDHSTHIFKLFAESKESQHELLMKLAIKLERQTQSTAESSQAHLEVRSQHVAYQIHPPEADGDVEPVPRGSKRLRVTSFERTSTSISTSSSKQREIEGWEPDERHRRSGSADLRCSQNICAELTGSASSATSTASMVPSSCLGHIEASSEPKFRHTFYSGPNRTCTLTTSPLTLVEMIKDIPRESVSQLDQLKLARSVSMTMLKLYSTPWLSQVWQLKDMAMFIDDVEELSLSLDTLHVDDECTSAFCNRTKDDRALQGNVPALHGARTEEEVRCNIKSRPLYSLGVALLQIDRWAEFDLGDIVAVRREAEKESSLKPRFWALTQRCLDCNFGYKFGTDFTKSMLQQKVCRDVIGELNELIRLAETWEFQSTDDED